MVVLTWKGGLGNVTLSPAAERSDLQSRAALILADELSLDLAPLLAGARLPLAMLPPEPEPLAAITDQLRRARRHGTSVSTLHLVAHGRSGAVRLGNRWITTASLVAAASELALWNVDRIALWSCHTGADPAFTATLAELTGAQVLSSSELIGSLAGQSINSAAGETLQLQALFTAPAIAAWAGNLANEYTLNNQRLDFTFAPNDSTRTVLLTGGYDASTAQLLPGTSYLYKNVVTVDGNVIDAIVSINGYQTAFINSTVRFDSNDLQYSANVPTNNPSYDPNASTYFQPNISINPTGLTPPPNLEQYVDFNISFVEFNPVTGNRDLVILKNLVIDIFDIDGIGASQTARQFVEIDDVGNYVIADNTKLIVSTGIGGEGIRFSANPTDGTNYTDKPGTPIGDAVRAQVRYPGGVSSFKFQLGDYAWNSRFGGYNALYALDFGSGKDFSIPTDEFGLKASSVCVAECGNQALITVCLVGPKDANGNPTRPPAADVTVDLYDFFNRSTAFGSLANVVTNADGSLTVNNEFTVSTSRLVFSTANWSQPQTITVTGLDDNVIDGSFIFNALLRASSTDQYYNQLSTSIDIKNLDNDTLITTPTVSSDAGFAVFDLTAAAGRILLFSAVDSTTSGIGNASIETSTDGGTTWTAYNGASGFKVPGADAVAFKARVSLAPLPMFDGSKTFKLVVGSPDVPCPTEATATVVGLASIGDHVWVDANGNGQQDAGEIGLAGVGVELFASVAGLPSGAAVATTTTDANGRYLFNNLAGGTYILRFITPSGYLFTAANIGADTTDSDAGPGADGSGLTGVLTLVAGEIKTTVDAGVYIPVSIGDFVWNDANSNGLQDADEQGIANLAVSLLAADGSQLATTTTNGVGLYNFENLKPGTYQVQVTTPTGLTATTKGTNPTSATDSNINATGRTDLITLGSGEANLSIDAGLTVGITSVVTSLAKVTASVPLRQEAIALLNRYQVSGSSGSRPASDPSTTVLQLNLNVGSTGYDRLADITLATEVNATASLHINSATGDAKDNTYDPNTGLGVELLDTNNNSLVDTLRVHLQDGASGDDDGSSNGRIQTSLLLANAPRSTVYRFYNQRSGVHFYTPDEGERDNVILNSYGAGTSYEKLKANPASIDPLTGGWGYSFEGIAYQALETQGTALYRFYNASKGYHFLSTSAEEANNVIKNSLGGGFDLNNAINKDPITGGWGYKYEGTTYKVSTIAQHGMDQAVYRFYNVNKGVHFYTASSDERDNVIRNSVGGSYVGQLDQARNAALLNSGWGYRYEGIGWYV